ncbi:MAG TPA: ferritin-like fold-containing protein [Candidatus Lumbricidophila sp.]|nr:ferritin-like fold-containing protein [Candidatus Lumbricidophila sp.]
MPRPAFLRPAAEPRAGLRRVEFAELAPAPVPFLGQAAYVQLALFENLSRAVIAAPNLTAKAGVARAAGVAVQKHHALLDELRLLAEHPEAVMAPFAPEIDRFRSLSAGSEWAEQLLGIWLSTGILDDYFARLAAGLPGALAGRVQAILEADEQAEVLVEELRLAIAVDPTLTDRLSLWGRSLVGDTLLIARSALHAAEGRVGADGRVGVDVEPVFTDLMTEHNRRMSSLGLSA